MGTWDPGPFGNDTAADFADALDDAASPGEREELVRGILTRTVKATGYPEEAQEAVAAAALIAAQCPDGSRRTLSTAPGSPFRPSRKTSGR
jgi:hypothetical protein